ncbi:ribosomal protein S3 [Mycoplasma haemofelis str. Langford 1]|uniref:Small ribosomal subunit protein uS3 n=1 Tax=Mycoplasma haemofelis (strain Langford 1) TaxID=941640 RepID=E8ZJZ3_MYCHL|nr:30S ribosomal protein S3 [Mycoplasma haemofelis]CBY93464.1 ribosomal protein S3 [Mycoplasma haemofelis str. Langford 1]
MGQKVNPNSLRFGLNKNWVSRWNSPNRSMSIKWLLEDEKVRKVLKERCRKAGVALIEIERFSNFGEKVTVFIYLHLAQPGLILSNDKELSLINKDLRIILGKSVEVKMDIKELKNPAVSAEIIGQEVVDAIENRVPHRLVIKRLMKRAMMAGALGVKVKLSGRINGVEIARNEAYSDGSIPLSTLRADIDYSFQIAKRDYGVLGVKVWVNRGLYFGRYFMPLPSAAKAKSKGDSKDNKYISATY